MCNADVCLSGVWVGQEPNFDLVDELIPEKDDTEDKDLQVRSFSWLSHNHKLIELGFSEENILFIDSIKT
jgi:hypothetical protein